MSSSVCVKIFLGFHQNGEIKMFLNQSSQWKSDKLFQSQELTEARFQDKEYIGFSITTPLSYSALKAKEKDLKNQLVYYCPKLQVDKHKVYLFPQLFLS